SPYPGPAVDRKRRPAAMDGRDSTEVTARPVSAAPGDRARWVRARGGLAAHTTEACPATLHEGESETNRRPMATGSGQCRTGLRVRPGGQRSVADGLQAVLEVR